MTAIERLNSVSEIVENLGYLRDWYAAHAPEAPEWFEPTMRKKPETPIWNCKYPELKDGEYTPIYRAFRYYSECDCFPENIQLPDNEKEYIIAYWEEWKNCYQQKEQWENDFIKEKFFQWRFYYADEMMNRRKLC